MMGEDTSRYASARISSFGEYNTTADITSALLFIGSGARIEIFSSREHPMCLGELLDT
jgi:hypothetical protein